MLSEATTNLRLATDVPSQLCASTMDYCLATTSQFHCRMQRRNDAASAKLYEVNTRYRSSFQSATLATSPMQRCHESAVAPAYTHCLHADQLVLHVACFSIGAARRQPAVSYQDPSPFHAPAH